MTVLAVSRCCYARAYSDVCQLGVVGGANDGGRAHGNLRSNVAAGIEVAM
jgi:hypothetical protein